VESVEEHPRPALRLLPALAPALLVIALLAAPGASARIQVSMETIGPVTGLFVTTDQFAADEPFHVNGRLTPEGAIANWDVHSLCVSSFANPFPQTCIDENDSDCSDDGEGFGRTIRCARVNPGVTVNASGGNDSVFVDNAGTDRVTVDAGTGDDLVSQGNAFSAERTGQARGFWNVTLGNGADTYTGSDGPDTVNGDAGDDRIDPGDATDQVNAGSGADHVFAGVQALPFEGDAYQGGSGFDTLDYSLRQTGIFAAIVGTTGGASGELDNIFGFERILGGSGNDSILGFSSDGGAGNDVLTGGDAGDTILGGTGADVIRGFAGGDILRARDGIADTRISCSTGTDSVELDLLDPNPDDAQSCEKIDRRPVEEEAATVIASRRARVDDDGDVRLRVRCPSKVGRDCAGTLSVELGRVATLRAAGASSSARYEIERGAKARVRIALRAADAARVRRAKRGRRAVVASSETGLKGAETVTRQIRLRAARS
jgi:hypothetical protein